MIVYVIKQGKNTLAQCYCSKKTANFIVKHNNANRKMRLQYSREINEEQKVVKHDAEVSVNPNGNGFITKIYGKNFSVILDADKEYKVEEV